jgi:hypothetical protein
MAAANKDILINILTKAAGTSSVKELNSVLSSLNQNTVSIGKNNQFYQKGVAGSISSTKALTATADGLNKIIQQQAASMRAANAVRAAEVKAIELTVRAKRAEVAQDDLALKQLRQEIQLRELAIRERRAAIAETRLATQETARSTAVATRSMAQQTAAVNGMAHANGAASFALLSLTQGIQDAGQFGMGMAQGIRAVNNNLQQFVTATILASSAAGGLTTAFKLMFRSLAGPAGFLLLFSAASAALEFFSNRSQRAKRDADSLGSAFSGLVSGMAPDGFRASSAGLMMVSRAASIAAKEYTKAGELVRRAQETAVEHAVKTSEEQTRAEREAADAKIKAHRPEMAVLAERIDASTRNSIATEVNTRFEKENAEAKAKTAAEIEASRAFWDQLSESKKKDAEQTHKLNQAYHTLLTTIGFGGLLSAMREQNAEFAESESMVRKAMIIINLEDSVSGLKDELSLLSGEYGKHIFDLRAEQIEIKKTIELLNKIAMLQRGIGLERFEARGVTNIPGMAERMEEIRRSTTLVGRAQGAQGIGEGMVGELRVMSDATLSEMDRLGAEIEARNNDGTKSWRAHWISRTEASVKAAGIVSSSIGDIGNVYMQLAQNGDKSNKRMFETGKKFAIAQALINTYLGFTEAIKQKGPLGLISGAAVLAAGMAKVAAIRATTMNGSGGSSGSSGSLTIGSAPSFFTGFSNASDFPVTTPSGGFASRSVNISLVAEGRELIGVIENESSSRARAGAPMSKQSTGLFSGSVTTR